MCHTTGVSFYLTSHSPYPCCLCEGAQRPTHKISESTLALKQQISDIREVLSSLSLRDEYMCNRVDQIEKDHNLLRQLIDNAWCKAFDRIDELEKKVKPLSKYISDCDKQRFDSDEALRERIENLESENLMRQDTIACVDRAYHEVCEELYKRIEALEAGKSNQSAFGEWISVNDNPVPFHFPVIGYGKRIVIPRPIYRMLDNKMLVMYGAETVDYMNVDVITQWMPLPSFPADEK